MMEIKNAITIESIQNKIDEAVKFRYYVKEDGGIELFVDYDEELSKDDLHNIMTAENPREVFDELIDEIRMEKEDYELDELTNEIYERLSKDEFDFYMDKADELRDWFFDKYYFYIDGEHFNTRVNVNIMIDCGNSNYHFTRDNILNYCNYYSDNGKDLTNSSILWLAKQQGKDGLLREAIKQTLDINKPVYKGDKFIESCIYELENLPSHMATLTFLVHMNLFDYLNLREAMESEKESNKSYTYEERKGTGTITISKDTMCGLFNTWDGGGSDLGIELDKDVVLPIKAIFTAEIETGKSEYGYSVDSVYGLVGSAWDGTIKETNYMNEDEIKAATKEVA